MSSASPATTGIPEDLPEPSLGGDPVQKLDSWPTSKVHVFETLRRVLGNLFGLDYRSLALYRMMIGAVLLSVTYLHAIETRIFYSDYGVLSRATFFGTYGNMPGFSLNFANGGVFYNLFLFALELLFAFMVMVGYRTRLAIIASYLLLISVQNRNPSLQFGADIVLRVGLFWTLFLPLSQCWSIDRLVGRIPPPPRMTYLGMAGFAFFMQFACIYIGTSLMKTGYTWRVSEDAVAWALALDLYSRDMGKWLLQFPKLTHGLTVFTLYLELYGPFLFLLPDLRNTSRRFRAVAFGIVQVFIALGLAWHGLNVGAGAALAFQECLAQAIVSRDGIILLCVDACAAILLIFPSLTMWGRMAGVLFFAGLQIGFGLCMFLGVFGTVMIVITVPFLPAVFWDLLAAPLGRKAAAKTAGARAKLASVFAYPGGVWTRWLTRRRAMCAASGVPLMSRHQRRVLGVGWTVVRDGALALLVCLVVVWNLRNASIYSLRLTVGDWQSPAVRLPHLTNEIDTFTYDIGLNQTWDMFAPDPHTIDGWFVIVGTKHNGQTVNLITGDAPASFDKPASVCRSYRNSLWMSYLITFWDESTSDPQALATYLGNEWNAQHTGAEQLSTVEIDMMLEWVEPGANGIPTHGEVSREVIWTQWF